MRINYSLVEFHAPFLCKGKNFTAKVKAGGDIELYYDGTIPNAKMCMTYQGALITFDSYHMACVIEEKAALPIRTKTYGSEHTQIIDKPHPASKEARALRAQQQSNQQGE